MAPWLRFLEAYMVQALLRSPTFHRGVEKVAKRVHQVRHGKPPEEMGGMNIDREGPGFLEHFMDELKGQLGQAEKKQAEQISNQARTVNTTGKSRPAEQNGSTENGRAREEQPAKPYPAQGDGVTKQGFLNEYVDALREQIRGDTRPK